MKALTLTQPWATLVAIRAKTIETRSWSTKYRGTLAIHAAKGFPRGCIELCLEEPFRSALAAARIKTPGELPRGAIIALGGLADVCPTTDPAIDVGTLELRPRERAFGDYSPGRFAWILSAVESLPHPLECRGALGLWDVPDRVAESIRFALQARVSMPARRSS